MQEYYKWKARSSKWPFWNRDLFKSAEHHCGEVDEIPASVTESSLKQSKPVQPTLLHMPNFLDTWNSEDMSADVGLSALHFLLTWNELILCFKCPKRCKNFSLPKGKQGPRTTKYLIGTKIFSSSPSTKTVNKTILYYQDCKGIFRKTQEAQWYEGESNTRLLSHNG